MKLDILSFYNCFAFKDHIASVRQRNPPNPLKCPLCQEEHSIDNKGIDAFRPDFKTKALVEKYQAEEARRHTAEANESTALPSEGDSRGQCRKHPSMMLNFFCKAECCQKAVCEMCWSEEHERHNVVLMSQKLKEINGELQNQITNYGDI